MHANHAMLIIFRLIGSIQEFGAIANVNVTSGNVTFTRPNFDVLVIVPADDAMARGQKVLAGTGSTFNNTNFMEGGGFSTSPIGSDSIESLASVCISPTLYDVFSDTSTQENERLRLVFISYVANSTVFQDPQRPFNGTGGLVFDVLRPSNQGPAPIDLEDPVLFQFQASQVQTACKAYIIEPRRNYM